MLRLDSEKLFISFHFRFCNIEREVLLYIDLHLTMTLNEKNKFAYSIQKELQNNKNEFIISSEKFEFEFEFNLNFITLLFSFEL